MRNSDTLWIWALLPLLLAAAITIPLLGVDAFNGDEPASVQAAGILSDGPRSLDATWSYITNHDPHQAYGWPLLLFVWGRLVGWSEVAIRTLSLFFGMLALAWVYRTGRDLFSPQAGLFATMLFGASVFFLAYMIHARAFTLVALCTTLTVWFYWQIALRPRPPGRTAQAGLLLSSIGLLYTHYFCALFLPVLGLFHLLFAPKNCRWRQPVIIFGVAALLAMAQLPGFWGGLERTVGNESLHDRALSAPLLVSHLVRNMTNGLVNPATPFDELLLISMPLALLAVFLLRRRAGNRTHAVWMTVFTSAILFALVIFINEYFRVIVDNRIRYLMPLWPLTVLLAGAALWRLALHHRRLVIILLAIWIVAGAWLNLVAGIRYEIGFFRRSDMHTAFKSVAEYVAKTDGLVMDHDVDYLNRHYLYVEMLDVPYVLYIRHRDDPLKHVLRLHAEYSYLWLLFLTQDTARMEALGDVLGRVSCERALDGEWGLTLVRYARSPVHCPDSSARLLFESDIQLTGPDIRLEGDRLLLYAGFRSADEALLASYSLAVHVIDANSGERVAQGDVGIGPGAFVPSGSEIDVSALPPGDYEVRLALYDWQTGERLSARELETDEVSDIHTLHRFRIG